ncbi:MAG TPA: choice-of-anchor D domain-containing protein, partial [Bacteroidota bacterium]
IAGIQTNANTGAPLNSTVVTLLPENRVYTGDMFNNGFYMFDSLAMGLHTIIFDTPRFVEDSVDVMVTSGGIHFVDRALSYSYPAVIQTTPESGDTSIAVSAAISVRFSNPMDTASVREALSVSPPVNTSLSWTPDLKVLSLTAFPAFDYYTWYTLMIDSMAVGVNGYRVDLNGDEVGGDTLTMLFRTETALLANALAFGQVKKDDTSKVTLNVVNRASYDISLLDIDHAVPEFQFAGAFPLMIAALDTATIEVSFNPTSYGSFSDVFVVSSDSGTIAVAVTGSSPVPNIRVPLTLIDFSSLLIDSTANRSFWISTSSINELRIDSMYTITASYSYSPQLSFPHTVAVMDTLFLTVTFSPQAEGMVYDTLVIINNSTVSVARIRLRGNGIVSFVEQIAGDVERFELFQNYPNPFNPETTIDFHIAEASHVRLEVLDVLGRRVRILAAQDFPPGAYRMMWNGSDDDNLPLSSGVYFYRLEAGPNIFSKKMLLLK